METKLSDPQFYQQDPSFFESSSQELRQLKALLTQTEERWLELEMVKEELAALKN